MKVSKVKAKVAAKVAKTKVRVADRTGVQTAANETGKRTAAKVVKTAMMLFALALVGCASTGEQPARSQTQRNDFRNCIVVVAPKVNATLDTMKVKAEGDTAGMPTIDLFTQAQANEGSETIAPKATPTNTTDVDTALDIPVNKGNAGTSAAGGAAERLLGAGADWVSEKLNGGGNANATTANGNSASATKPATGTATPTNNGTTPAAAGTPATTGGDASAATGTPAQANEGNTPAATPAAF